MFFFIHVETINTLNLDDSPCLKLMLKQQHDGAVRSMQN